MQELPWLRNYPANVRPSLNVTDSYTSVMDMVNQCLIQFADAPGYVNMGKTLTFGEVDHLSLRFAAYLQQIGLKKGDRIAIQMPNLLQYPVVLFGAIRAGLIIVNTNPLYTARELEHQLKDSGATAIVILANFAHNLEKIVSNTPVKHIIITEIGDLLGGFKKILVNFVVKRVKKMVPPFHLPQAVSFSSALKKANPQSYVAPALNLSDTGFLQYTGGTTGISKGAALSHGNIVANTLQIYEWIQSSLKERKEIVITALPLYHIFAFTVNCLFILRLGGLNVLITNPRDMKSFIKDLKTYPFTLFTGVNTLFNGLMNQPDINTVNFSTLKLAVGGGMAVQKSVNERWKSLTGVPILEGYGLSETSPVLTMNPTNGSDRIGTIGLPMPNTEMAIFDDEGVEVPLGERGEICARGPQVMPGYWQKPDETALVFFPGGWFRTGDIGIMDEDGFFRIVDRKKDMILVSGFNVYPNEVEDVVASHPGVLEAAAIGVPDEKSTEAVKIYVVKKDQSLSKEALIQFCKENLTGYKVPKHVAFISELPKSNVGKIIRRELREKEGT
ncbi:MAG: AMP-binding protein [Bacteroidia bacterium]|nr:AMP-binding protein [Bacteroidia bacterium]